VARALRELTRLHTAPASTAITLIESALTHEQHRLALVDLYSARADIPRIRPVASACLQRILNHRNSSDLCCVNFGNGQFRAGLWACLCGLWNAGSVSAGCTNRLEETQGAERKVTSWHGAALEPGVPAGPSTIALATFAWCWGCASNKYSFPHLSHLQ
jgi:hypothetical protein